MDRPPWCIAVLVFLNVFAVIMLLVYELGQARVSDRRMAEH